MHNYVGTNFVNSYKTWVIFQARLSVEWQSNYIFTVQVDDCYRNGKTWL